MKRHEVTPNVADRKIVWQKWPAIQAEAETYFARLISGSALTDQAHTWTRSRPNSTELGERRRRLVAAIIELAERDEESERW